jgi:hypothetical protein
LLGLGEGNTRTCINRGYLTPDLLGLGEEIKKTDANQVQIPHPRSRFFPRFNTQHDSYLAASLRVSPAGVRGMMSRSSPPRRRCAGSEFWAPPPGRSTAARSPMGWTRAPARGPAAAPPSSTGHHGCHLSLLLAVSRFFGGGFKRQREGQAVGAKEISQEGAATALDRGGAPHRRRRGYRPRGRSRPAAAAGPVQWRCGWGVKK